MEHYCVVLNLILIIKEIDCNKRQNIKVFLKFAFEENVFCLNY